MSADDADEDTPSEVLTHLDAQGRAVMVDVSDKEITVREAVASGVVRMLPATRALIVAGDSKKGDVLAAARIAGIAAAKRTWELIPLCHQIALTKVSVDFSFDPDGERIIVRAVARARDRTGVEMEALTAVAIASLTLYDMLKAVDRTITLDHIHLEQKTGGRSGTR